MSFDGLRVGDWRLAPLQSNWRPTDISEFAWNTSPRGCFLELLLAQVITADFALSLGAQSAHLVQGVSH